MADQDEATRRNWSNSVHLLRDDKANLNWLASRDNRITGTTSAFRYSMQALRRQIELRDSEDKVISKLNQALSDRGVRVVIDGDNDNSEPPVGSEILKTIIATSLAMEHLRAKISYSAGFQPYAFRALPAQQFESQRKQFAARLQKTHVSKEDRDDYSTYMFAGIGLCECLLSEVGRAVLFQGSESTFADAEMQELLHFGYTIAHAFPDLPEADQFLHLVGHLVKFKS